MRYQTFLYSLALATITAEAAQTVYLIRHGEKPADDGTGLSAAGVARSQCLRTVFGDNSPYNISHIMAQTPKSNGKRARPFQTVEPVAQDLGLSVDISCDRDDPKCVKKVVDEQQGNVLICWEHDALTNIATELGAIEAPTYPDDSFDIIWTDPAPFTEVTAFTSEDCPGLDA